MAGLFSTFFSSLFGSSHTKDEEPDDGGLAEFAKQLAQELDEEAKSGKKRAGVSADNVLKVQQGSHGAKAYLLDTSDFQKVIAKELRDSVAPVTEGILKTRCGEKGAGYMNVHKLYVFNVRREDAVEEYNAAMDVIDAIGERLLGDRYTTGERMKIPVATIIPDEFFTPNGSFDLKKANQTVDWVRESGTHGPANVNWETGEVSVAVGAPNWKPNKTTPIDVQNKEWQEQHHTSAQKISGEWQEIAPTQKKVEEKQWSEINVPKPEKTSPKEWSEIKNPAAEEAQTATNTEQPAAIPAEEKQWSTINVPKPEKATPKEWSEIEKSTAEETSLEINTEQPTPIRAEIKQPVIEKVEPTNLKQLGTLILAFRPSWLAREETINTYAGCAYRKVSGVVLTGEQIYPDDYDPAIILKIDQALADQALIHLKQTNHIEQKTIVLPFHFISLAQQNSPLKNLLELDETIRKSIWIEIVGLGSNASPNRISTIISTYQGKVGAIGLRFDLGEVSRAMIERSKADFLSCDVESSTLHGLQMRGLEQDLPDLLNMAKTCKMDMCTWGLRNRQDLMFALQEGSTLINGHALAKEMKKPGKIIPVSAGKLINH